MSRKQLQTEEGTFELATPRHSDGSFEPQPVANGLRYFTSMGDKILSLYATGMITGIIQSTYEEIYSAHVSLTLISKVTEAVIDEVIQWHSPGHWMPFIRLFIWTPSWSKFGRINKSQKSSAIQLSLNEARTR